MSIDRIFGSMLPDYRVALARNRAVQFFVPFVSILMKSPKILLFSSLLDDFAGFLRIFMSVTCGHGALLKNGAHTSFEKKVCILTKFGLSYMLYHKRERKSKEMQISHI